jgi:hypothetical protein
MGTIIVIGLAIFLLISAIVLSKTETPVHLDGANKPITSQDGLEDVIKEPVVNTDIVLDKKELEVEFVEKQPTKKLKGIRQLSDHIATVVENNPDSKKHLNKRQRKTVDKIVKEKKQ